MRIPNLKLLRLNILQGRTLNKKRLIIISSLFILLIVAGIFITGINLTTFTIKEQKPACTDECDFEGKLCEDAKIFECSLNENGCKHKNLVETCPEGAQCSTLSTDKCYTPQFCDGDFHTCISDVLYKMCENGKTIEGTDMKKCPEGLMCNRNPNNFALCIEKDY